MNNHISEKLPDSENLPEWLQDIRQIPEEERKTTGSKASSLSGPQKNRGQSDQAASLKLTGFRLWWSVLRRPSPTLFATIGTQLPLKTADSWVRWVGFWGGFFRGFSLLLMIWFLFSQSPLIDIAPGDFLWLFLFFPIIGAIITAMISGLVLRGVVGVFHILAKLGGGRGEFQTLTILIATVFGPFYFVFLSLGTIPVLGPSVLIIYLLLLFFPVCHILQVSHKLSAIKAQTIVGVVIGLAILICIVQIWSFIVSWPSPMIEFLLTGSGFEDVFREFR